MVDLTTGGDIVLVDDSESRAIDDRVGAHPPEYSCYESSLAGAHLRIEGEDVGRADMVEEPGSCIIEELEAEALSIVKRISYSVSWRLKLKPTLILFVG